MAFSRNLVSVIAVLAIAKVSLAAVDYCNQQTSNCNGYVHVACNNNGAFQSGCRPDASIVPMTPALRNYILNAHNTLRNEFAKGVNSFKPANRLGVVQWDANLARLAELNVKKCDLSPDACRNTMSYMYVGQNTAKSEWTPDQKYTVEEVAQRHIESWYSQKRLITMDQTQSYPLDQPAKPFGHFTVLVHQKSAFVGCAMMRQTEANGEIRHLTTCNYSHDNVVGKPTYSYGKTGFKCKTGMDPVFTNLCSANEVYSVNHL